MRELTALFPYKTHPCGLRTRPTTQRVSRDHKSATVASYTFAAGFPWGVNERSRGAAYRSLVRRGMLHVVDHQDWSVKFLRFQLQPQLFLNLRPAGRKSGWGSSTVGVIVVTVVGAKNQTSIPWTGAPCSPKRTPGFPVEFPGVDELHAAFLNESRTRICWWRPVQEIRDHGPKKTGRSPPNAFCYVARCCGLEQEVLRHGVKALEESVFGPCTLRRTWGTRPEPTTVVGSSNPARAHRLNLDNSD